MHWAVSNGHCDCAQLLIQAGAVVDIQSNVITLDYHTIYFHDHTHDNLIDDTQYGDTALHWAVDNGHYDCAQLLIQSGADVDIKDRVSTLYTNTVCHHDHIHDISYR